MKRALIIAAHPDDDILGCGGIISRFRNKVEFKVIFIAEGTTCRLDKDTPVDIISSQIKTRNNFGENALEFLGVKNNRFYNLPCGKLDQISQLDINKIIENEINSFKPDIVFTHSPGDSNKDHHKVYDATIIATRPGSGVNTVLSYEVLSSTEWGFNSVFSPTIFYSLTLKDVNMKHKAFSYYKSEQKSYPYPRSTKGIITLAQYRGMQSGTDYAEAFQLIRQNL